MVTNVVIVEITDDARKHGFDDADIWHAFRNPIRVWEFDGYVMVVGPALDGTLMEVGFSPDRDKIFHADDARQKFLGRKPWRNR